MKSIRCRLHCATWCEYFKSGECTSSVKCKYQTEHISVKFPETIFMPTKEAWKKMQAEIVRLTTENAELRERLDKAIEPPVKIGDTIHTVIKNCFRCQHYNASWAQCGAPATANFDCESTHGICFTQDIIDDECKKHLCVAKLEFDLRFLDPKTGELKPQYCIDEKVAEARLKKLQEDEE